MTDVVAKTVSLNQLAYVCPQCGVEHRHGSRSLRDRVESRGSHCSNDSHDVEIHVDASTVRVGADGKPLVKWP